MEGPLSPGRPEPDRERVVVHVDMDCFYAACERLREPALRGEPVVVGMGYEPGDSIGAVATASYEAREYGVDSAMPITQALDRLPRKVDAARDDDLSVDEAGFYRPVDMSYYESVSDDASEVLHAAVEGRGPDGEDGVVREVSIDEAYLDVSGVGWDDPAAFARRVKQRIASAAGVTASVGVAPNMSTAKVASDHDKPDGLVVVRPDEVREFLAPLSVEELHGVGPVTAETLGEMDVETAGELAAADPDALAEAFGSRGREVHDHARGRDDREVTPVGKPKSLSSESSLEPTADTARKRQLVRSLAEEVAARARSKDALYKTIGIKVVTPPFDVNTRAESLSGPVDDPELVESVALDLLGEFSGDRVRKLGVRVSNLDFSDADQASLDGWERSGDGGEDRQRRGQTSLGDFSHG
ncbi:DNA polymerase IV [Halorarius halobius]|uniref:DNA polymerase IV n=1 Tax=Halorarius halobius TaxID=2962671 RepID=UPI0020CE3071|nr:DNA polymerase IV [Halorarius halobius]